MAVCCKNVCPQFSASIEHRRSFESKFYNAIELESVNVIKEEEAKSDADTSAIQNIDTTAEYEVTFSFRNFEILRSFSYQIFLLAFIKCLLFPFTVTWQTIIFVFEFNSRIPNDIDFSTYSNILYYDILHVLVGRVELDSESQANAAWFLAQTKQQKLARIVFSIIFSSLWVYALLLAIFNFANMFPETLLELAVVETLGPSQIFIFIALMYSYFVAASRPILPAIPNARCLKAYTLHLTINKDEIRHEKQYKKMSCYAFYNMFLAHSNEYGINVDYHNIIRCLIASIIFASTGFVIRAGNVPYTKLTAFIAIMSWIVNVIFFFAVSLSIVTKIFHGLSNSIKTNQVLTYILKPESSIFFHNSCMDKVCRCGERRKLTKLPYLDLAKDDNFISWLELRSYVYWKNRLIVSQSESIIAFAIFLDVFCAFYLAFRILQAPEYIRSFDYGPSFSSVLFAVILVTFMEYAVLINSLLIHRLQTFQHRFVLAQKGQEEYRMAQRVQTVYRGQVRHRDDAEYQMLSLALNSIDKKYDTLLEQIDVQNISPMVYGITLDTALLRSALAVCISLGVAITQYFTR